MRRFIMEESIRLSAGVFTRARKQIQGWVERKVDACFIEDQADLEKSLDRCIKVIAIVACISAVVYILIPAILVLSGVWK
jgi:hypothetical protein